MYLIFYSYALSQKNQKTPTLKPAAGPWVIEMTSQRCKRAVWNPAVLWQFLKFSQEANNNKTPEETETFVLYFTPFLVSS